MLQPGGNVYHKYLWTISRPQCQQEIPAIANQQFRLQAMETDIIERHARKQKNGFMALQTLRGRKDPRNQFFFFFLIKHTKSKMECILVQGQETQEIPETGVKNQVCSPPIQSSALNKIVPVTTMEKSLCRCI